MTDVSRLERCTVHEGDGRLCGTPALPDAPVSVCGAHVATLIAWVNTLSTAELLHMRAGQDIPQPRFAPLPQEPYRAVVYYLRVGDIIKVGVTGRIKQRLAGYPPYSVLLATEPGGDELERQRHAQFRADLAHGREWFHPSASLIAHINTLREQPLTAADLAA